MAEQGATRFYPVNVGKIEKNALLLAVTDWKIYDLTINVIVAREEEKKFVYLRF